MDSEWESLLADVEKKLVTLSLTTDLSAVSKERRLQPSGEVKSSCCLLTRLILCYLESEEVTGLEDSGLSVLLAACDFIDILRKVNDDANESACQEEMSVQPETGMEHPLPAETKQLTDLRRRVRASEKPDESASHVQERFQDHWSNW